MITFTIAGTEGFRVQVEGNLIDGSRFQRISRDVFEPTSSCLRVNSVRNYYALTPRTKSVRPCWRYILQICAPKIWKIDFLLSYNVGWLLILKVSLSWVQCRCIWKDLVVTDTKSGYRPQYTLILPNLSKYSGNELSSTKPLKWVVSRRCSSKGSRFSKFWVRRSPIYNVSLVILRS